MSLRPPTADEIREIGDRMYLDLTDEEVNDYRDYIDGMFDSYDTVRSYGQPDHQPTTPGPRGTGYRARSGDPYNTWITRCDIPGEGSGPLSGLNIGLKDTISVAGIELTCGSEVMEGYVPGFDATIVSRLLNAGGRIVGKTNMDDMAATGNGHSSAFGPTLNPHDEDYLAGGSSGGSAIAVATGDADVTIGGDQGGSIRVPAAWTGVVGLKPTYGLVPYTGIVGLDKMVDHAGPLARDVQTIARTLSVLAGKDPKDPRQPESVPVEDYEANLDGVVDGLSIGVVKEGFNWPQSESTVNSSVQGGLDELDDLGASVEEVSVPMHADAEDIFAVVLSEAYVPLYQSEGLGWGSKGWHDTSWADAFGKFRRAQGGDLPPSVKVTLLLGAYVSDQYHSKYYAEGMNLVTELTDTYDELLETYDLLAMPTSPHGPHEHVPDQTRAEFLDDAWTMNANTCPFNLTGHPAISVPVEPNGGLPVGLMLVGSEFDDSTVLNAASALERDASA